MHLPDLKQLLRTLSRGAGVLLIATLSIAALGACGDDNDSADETPIPSDTATASNAPTAGPNAGEFEQLSAAYAAGVDGRVEYSIESENFGVHPQGTWVTYRLDSEIREDWTQSANGYEETSVAIVANDGFFFCNQTPFVVTCEEQPSATELEVVMLLFTTVKDYIPALLNGEAEYTAVDLPDEAIAGEDANCFDVAINGRIGGGPDGTEQTKFCYRDDGTLLKMERRVAFTDPMFEDAVLNVIAQETGEAVESDFDLPANPTQPQG